MILHDGQLDDRLGEKSHLDGLSYETIAQVARVMPLEVYAYALPENVARVVPRIAKAGAFSLTLQVEAWAYSRYLGARGTDQAPWGSLAGALAAAIDAARRDGICEVGLAVLLGSNVSQLLEELIALGSAPDRVVVLCGHSPTWGYSDTCEDQLRDLSAQIERAQAPCRVAVHGGITMASLPMAVRAGADEATILDLGEYVCYGQQQLHCAARRRAEGGGRIEPHLGELEAWVRCDAVHRWVAALRADEYAARMVRESTEVNG